VRPSVAAVHLDRRRVRADRVEAHDQCGQRAVLVPEYAGDVGIDGERDLLARPDRFRSSWLPVHSCRAATGVPISPSSTARRAVWMPVPSTVSGAHPIGTSAAVAAATI
jgi:hypothetical protein